MAQRTNKKGRQFQGRGNAWGTPSQPPIYSSSPGIEGVYANPHVAHALTTLIGCEVEVKTLSGLVYNGILSAISPNMDVVLSAAHDISKALSKENLKQKLELRFNEVVNISAKQERNNSLSSTAADIFKTDTEISRSNGSSSNREFEPFTDFGDTSMSLEDESSTGWSVEEMFSVNRDKFQVKSNYDDELPQYTTELKRNTEGYQVRAARAKVLASEIEGKDKHGFDDAGTEEELFSSVTREHQEAPPPHPTLLTSSHQHTPPTTSRPNTDVPSTIINDKTDVADQNVPLHPLPSTSTGDTPPPVTTVTSIESDPSPKLESKGQGSDSTEDNKMGVAGPDNAESAPVKEVVVKAEDSSTVEKVPPSSNETPPSTEATTQATPTTEAPPTSTDSTVEETEKSAVKKSTFKLNPNAQEFKLNPNATEFKPPTSFSPASTSTLSSTPASPSHTVTTTSSPSSTTYTPHSSGRRPPYKPRPRTTTPTQPLFPTSDYIIQTMQPQTGGYVIPQVGGVVRQVAPGQVMYPYHQLQPAVINAAAYAPHLQQVVTSGVTGASPNPQGQIMLTPLQQQQMFQQSHMLTQQPGLFQQPGGQLQQTGAVLPTVGLGGGVSQGQHYQQVIYTPTAGGTVGGQVMYNVPAQGGVPTPGGATPIVVSGATVPLQQAQPLISTGANPTQQAVFTPPGNPRVSYPPHPPGQ